MSTEHPTPLKDWQFGVAVVVAPVGWGVMAWMFHPAAQLGDVLSRPALLLMLAGLYPVLEEWVFRGVLQGRLREYAWGLRQFGPLTVANIFTSVVFTSLHFFNHPPLAAILVFVPSLVFGYFRDRNHGLSSPIILHVWYNTGYFLIFGIG